MWHKCKNGTLVNLASYRLCRVANCGTRGFYLMGWPIRLLSTDTALRWPAGADELATGTREECEAEMAEIEAKIVAGEKGE